MNEITVGFAVTGSFCTFEKAFVQMERLVSHGFRILPIFSENAATVNTRFGQAADWVTRAETICGRQVLRTLTDVEPIGPKGWTDVMLVAPCTGNTAAKLAQNVIDTPVTLAVKSHLRTGRPVVLALSTNDALSGSAENIGVLMNRRHYYFVPMRQDAPKSKPRSVVADFDQIEETVHAALNGQQLQPIMLPPL